MNRTELIKRCQSGDRTAWRELYELYSSDMYRVCLRYTSSADTANDILHDGFIRLFTKIGDFGHRGEFEGWMRKIFVTTSLESIRKNSRIEFSQPDREPHIEDENQYETIEQLGDRELISHIERLPLGYKTIIKLYCVEGYSHAEIASMVGISSETSRSQLLRAKKSLMKILQKDEKR